MRRSVFHIVLVAAAFLLVAGPVSYGKVIYVDDDAVVPGDGTSWATAYRFLQDALTDAEVAEKPVEIRVAQGLYKPDRSWFAPAGTGNTEVKFRLVDGMSLLGGYAGVGAIDPNVRDFQAFETVLSGDLAGNDADVTDPTLLRDDPTRDENSWQVVFIRNGQSRLEGFTITGGTAGGVFLTQYPWDATNDVTVSDCMFYGNRGSVNDMPSGGALTTWLEVVEAKVVFRRCSFVGNAGDTGAIRARDVVLDQCRFECNYSWGEWGGAASVGGNSTVSDCVFIGNSARRAAGALYVSSIVSDITKVLRCRFQGNSASKWGGGLVCHGNADVVESVFIGNQAGMRGGAGYDVGNVRMANCILAGNWAGERGGAWFSWDWSSLEIARCTAVENRAPEGPFLGVDHAEKNPDHLLISNCVLSNGADEIWSDATPVEVAYTCFGGRRTISAQPNDWLVLGEGIIEGDPCLVDTPYWDSNGTPDDPTDDFFVEGDYHLKSQAGRWDEASGNWVQDKVTSPCIDAGDPNSPIMYEPFPNGGVINMGAYGGTAQASKSYFGAPLCETIIAGDINGDCHVDLADIIILLDHWLEDHRSDAPTDED